MLCLSQFLSTDAQKKEHKSLHTGYCRQACQKNRDKKQKRHLRKIGFLPIFASEKRCGRVVDIEFLSEIETKKTCPMDSSCHGSLTEVGSNSILGPASSCSFFAPFVLEQALFRHVSPPTRGVHEVGPTKKKFTGP